ncbi:hypothetical protein AB0B10_25305 [Micromonospora arborensis]|uniref:hypothetical protein n=1 Tax=Micromonospora arborensis TaxID=2116518 RepID=UPI0033DFCC62
MSGLSPRKLRGAIAGAMRDGMTRTTIEAFCHEDLKLPVPQPAGVWDQHTKFNYVDVLLKDKSLAELAAIAVQVTDEIPAVDLLELARQVGAGGVAGELKNLIFAANGPKPEIVFRDAINNDIAVVKNERYCLIYDRPLGAAGLTWQDLTTWWAQREGLVAEEREIARSLHQRLMQSLANDAERRIMHAYARRYIRYGSDIPALIPQVYLHYDPYARSERGAAGAVLARQRMDFLLLLPNRGRIVIECDGVQHYADDLRRADSRRYAEMVAEDRALRLRGYEVYRFGGYELTEGPESEALLDAFFDQLASRHTT